MEDLITRRWALSFIVVVASVGLGYVLRSFLIRRLTALFARTATNLDDLVLAAGRRFVPLRLIDQLQRHPAGAGVR